MDLSNSLKYGTVVWTALSALVDSDTDADRDPNNQPIPNVTVTFIASTPRVVVQDPYPITVFLESVTAQTNQHGVLVGPDGVEGIKLIASDNVKANPVNFTYRVNISGHGVPITVDISVPSDGIVDLSFLVPVIASAGKVLAPERGPQGIEGPPPELAVGTVKPTDDSSEAAAYFRPNPDGGHFLDLDLPIGPKGEKGDPGGWIGTSLSTTQHLDTVTTPGLYYQANSSAASPANGYPANMPQDGSSTRGVLEVFNFGGAVIQRYTNVGRGFFVTSAQYPRITYSRASGSIWSNWTTQTSQRVDNTVGKVIYTWDDTANREQLIYGDTGTRSIIVPGTIDQYFYIRRVGSVVELQATTLKPNVVGAGSYPAFIPEGFRPPAYRNFQTSPYWSSEDIRKWRIGKNGNLDIANLLEDDILNMSSTWTTHEAWPTSLPGSAWAAPI